ncbi:GNAT family N-acetyltransferase [Thermoleophilia bacterium SCSIO 60948]|nr:GNAT family N-acetyltransferase [Thermoleophilia bacterium SCSIO 60948]
MAIREATEADAERLLELFRGYTTFYETDPPDSGLRELIRSQTAARDDEAFILVATDESDVPVGFAHCQWKWSSLRGARIPFLDDLFVDPDSRGGGHADALIEAIADRARAAGSPAVEWLTMPDNHRAQKVYNRVGGHSEELLEYSLDVE